MEKEWLLLKEEYLSYFIDGRCNLMEKSKIIFHEFFYNFCFIEFPEKSTFFLLVSIKFLKT